VPLRRRLRRKGWEASKETVADAVAGALAWANNAAAVLPIAATTSTIAAGLYSAGAKGRGLRRRPLPLDPIPALCSRRKDGCDDHLISV